MRYHLNHSECCLSSIGVCLAIVLETGENILDLSAASTSCLSAIPQSISVPDRERLKASHVDGVLFALQWLGWEMRHAAPNNSPKLYYAVTRWSVYFAKQRAGFIDWSGLFQLLGTMLSRHAVASLWGGASRMGNESGMSLRTNLCIPQQSHVLKAQGRGRGSIHINGKFFFKNSSCPSFFF